MNSTPAAIPVRYGQPTNLNILKSKDIILKEPSISNKKRTKHKKLPTSDDDYEQDRPFPLYVLLSCGLILAMVGLYLTITNSFASGISSPGRFGQGGGNAIVVNGPATIITGIAFCIFPTYQLIKRRINKKSKCSNNPEG